MSRSLILRAFSRSYCSSCFRSILETRKSKLPKLVLDVVAFQTQLQDIKSELRLRKQSAAILRKLADFPESATADEAAQFLESVALSLPNRMHPAAKDIASDYRIVKEVGHKQDYSFQPQMGATLLAEKDLLLMNGLNRVCGDRSYYFIGEAAALEQALVDYTVDKLLAKNFTLLSVPDILSEEVVQRCGMPTSGERTQVYKLDPEIYGEGWCLSGTSEIAIAQYLMNSNFEKEELPKSYATVSRCYRAEVSSTATEKGIYRVHQFTKVEMFGVCLPDQSDDMLQSFLDIQEELFGSYGLHYRVLDMAAHELGLQAYRKFDIEAWMPGSNRYGEITSCSNCTDYQMVEGMQAVPNKKEIILVLLPPLLLRYTASSFDHLDNGLSRRLNIRCGDTFLHTVNGTACAIPRAINAICETFQVEKGRVVIPDVLQPYTGFDVLGMKRGPTFFKQLKRVTISKAI